MYRQRRATAEGDVMPSKIEWTNETWNPTTGCTKVSPGCAHCYAESLTKRYAGAPGWPAEFKPWTPGNAAENVVLHPDRLDAPLRWKTPRMVFVDSMSDLFHENIPDDYIDKVFAVMALTPQHTYQVLTKRPERMREYMHIEAQAGLRVEELLDQRWAEKNDKPIRLSPMQTEAWPLPNVWLGVTVENQHWADVRIPILLDTPAAVRFVSAEPLLGPVDLEHYLHASWGPNEDERLDWVIVGGESGPKHRLFNPEWARSIVMQCSEGWYDVACFVKQLGGLRPGNKLEDLPPDLRVREFPR